MKPITKTTDGLRDFLFDQLEGFNSNKLAAEKVKTNCEIIGVILETAKVELQYATFSRLADPKGGIKKVTPLQLSHLPKATRRISRVAR